MEILKYTQKDIESWDKVFRLNLINSISGYKSANLIGSRSEQQNNLAIFSSVIHLGSNPPFLGFIMRPNTLRRDTLENIRANGYYTINHINRELIQRAHYTSAKFEKEVSEFDLCKIEKVFLDDFPAPFVKESTIKVGMELKEEIPIQSNDTILVVGEIKSIYLEKESLEENGQIDLNKADIACISGLNRYHIPKQVASYPYARLEELPDFK